jgi:autotransporter-associated beta strand protein
MTGLTRANVRAGGARIDSGAFNVTVPQPLLDGGAGGGLTKLGTGTLTLTARNTYTGPTTVSAGTLSFGASQRLSSLVIAAGAKAAIAPAARSTIVAESLEMAGGPGAWTGVVDVGAGALAIDYDAGRSSPLLTVADQVRSARYGASGPWTGPGIASSRADATSVGLGYAESAVALGAGGGVFGGETVDGTAVLLRATPYGDANLDGVVSAADLLAVRRNLGATGGRAVWQNGDFNYDGRVGADDMLLLRRNFGTRMSLASLSPSPLLSSEANAAVSVVPEPSTLVWLLPLFALRRRRRSRG